MKIQNHGFQKNVRHKTPRECNNMNIICKVKFGSHLYGTASEKSDTDYKGIYLPTLEDLILQRVSKSINNITKKDVTQKNTKDDVDYEIYSLHNFLHLAYNGETVALDMIHAPKDWEETTSSEWEFIKQNRHLFYTKNLRSYMGYVRTQAAKYGVKGSRLADAEKVLNFLKSFNEQEKQFWKLSDIWDKIPEGEHIKKINIEEARQGDNRALEVCSRKLMADTKIWYSIECVQKFYDSYGERAQMAKDNKGVDFKAVSHAFRAGLQLKEIYETGDLKYPLKDAKFLLDIKQGKYHYANELAVQLDKMVNEIETLSNNSKYPEKVDKSFWENWLLSLYKG